MTVSSTNRKAGPYTRDGIATAYPFYFKVFATADVLAVQTDLLGVETTLVETTHYTVSLNADQDNNPGGTVTMVTAGTAGYLLTLTSQVGELQPADIQNAGGFYPQVIEDALDRVTILAQQIKLLASRGMVLPLSSSASANLPNPVANMLLGWNASASALENKVANGSTGISAFWAAVLALSGFAPGAVGAPSIAADGDSNTGFYFPAADTMAGVVGGTEFFRATPNSTSLKTTGGEQFRVSNAANAVNYIGATGAPTGSIPTLEWTGSDATVHGYIRSKGASSQIYLAPNNSTSLTAVSAPSAVNYLTVQSSATGSPASLYPAGSDTNIPIAVLSKGSGAIKFYRDLGSTQMFQIDGSASSVNFWRTGAVISGSSPQMYVDGSDTNVSAVISSKGTGGINFYTAAGTDRQFVVSSNAGAVNYLQANGAAAGGNPTISTQGSDSNVGFAAQFKGTGASGLGFQVLGNNGAYTAFAVQGVASAVNRLDIVPSATGNAAAIVANGSDTNIDLQLSPKGTGNVRFGTYAAKAAEAFAGYITIKDSGGTSRKVMVCA